MKGLGTTLVVLAIAVVAIWSSACCGKGGTNESRTVTCLTGRFLIRQWLG